MPRGPHWNFLLLPTIVLYCDNVGFLREVYMFTSTLNGYIAFLNSMSTFYNLLINLFINQMFENLLYTRYTTRDKEGYKGRSIQSY